MPRVAPWDGAALLAAYDAHVVEVHLRDAHTVVVDDESLAFAAGDLAAKMARPLTTSALTPEYRREMIRVFTKRAVLEAAGN